MTARLRVLDMFSGTGSITTAFRRAGHECDSLDLDARFEPTFCTNVLTWGAPARPLRRDLGQLPVRTVLNRAQQRPSTARPRAGRLAGAAHD